MLKEQKHGLLAYTLTFSVYMEQWVKNQDYTCQNLIDMKYLFPKDMTNIA